MAQHKFEITSGKISFLDPSLKGGEEGTIIDVPAAPGEWLVFLDFDQKNNVTKAIAATPKAIKGRTGLGILYTVRVLSGQLGFFDSAVVPSGDCIDSHRTFFDACGKALLASTKSLSGKHGAVFSTTKSAWSTFYKVGISYGEDGLAHFIECKFESIAKKELEK